MEKKLRVILALDEIQDINQALELVRKIGNRVYAVKIHNLYDRTGPDIVEKIKEAGALRVWVDFKFLDIPNTVKLRARDINADFITVHATGGVAMMKNALTSGKEVIAIMVLTSYENNEVQTIYNRTVEEQTLVLVQLAKEAGIKNIVCSPHEVKMLSSNPEFEGMNFFIPGIRSAGKDANDQMRIATPVEAIKNGATFLVMGRQITLAEDPIEALGAVEKEIQDYEESLVNK